MQRSWLKKKKKSWFTIVWKGVANLRLLTWSLESAIVMLNRALRDSIARSFLSREMGGAFESWHAISNGPAQCTSKVRSSTPVISSTASEFWRSPLRISGRRAESRKSKRREKSSTSWGRELDERRRAHTPCASCTSAPTCCATALLNTTLHRHLSASTTTRCSAAGSAFSSGSTSTSGSGMHASRARVTMPSWVATGPRTRLSRDRMRMVSRQVLWHWGRTGWPSTVRIPWHSFCREETHKSSRMLTHLYYII